MNYLDSECSSGCESGWTVYLEQSFLSPNASAGDFHGKTTGKFCNGIRRNEEEDNDEEDDDVKEEEEEEEEEDLSMVSDASSGPPHNFHEDNKIVLHLNHNNGEDYKCSKSGGEKRRKMKEQQGFASFRPHREQPSFLDDTASSPLFNFSNNNMQDFAMTNDKQGSLESAVLDYSQGFSATHFQGRPAFQDPFGSFLHSSTLSGNHLQEMSDLKGIRKWK